MRFEQSRKNFCDFCADYLSEKIGGASTVSLKQAYIDSRLNRINHLASSTVGLSIWLRTDVSRRFIQLDNLWYLKEGLHEDTLSK
jgi:hypothetical protein